MTDFFDTNLEGLGRCIKEVIGKHQGTEAELMQKIKDYTGKNGGKFEAEDSIVIWRALKFFTEGSA